MGPKQQRSAVDLGKRLVRLSFIDEDEDQDEEKIFNVRRMFLRRLAEMSDLNRVQAAIDEVVEFAGGTLRARDFQHGTNRYQRIVETAQRQGHNGFTVPLMIWIAIVTGQPVRGPSRNQTIIGHGEWEQNPLPREIEEGGFNHEIPMIVLHPHFRPGVMFSAQWGC